MRPDDLRGRAIFRDSLDSVLTVCIFYHLAFSRLNNPNASIGGRLDGMVAPGWRSCRWLYSTIAWAKPGAYCRRRSIRFQQSTPEQPAPQAATDLYVRTRLG